MTRRKTITEIASDADNPGLRALNGDFLIFGRSARIFDRDGKELLSASKLNFNVIDASASNGECALVFQEQTASQTAIYFLGIYSMKTGALARQWSTAETDAIRVFQLPGRRSVVALADGFSILTP